MLAFRLCRRAFRYIFACSISTPLPNSRFPFPVSRSQFPFPSPHGSQRMPLQSLTHWRLPKAISNLETGSPRHAETQRPKVPKTQSPRVPEKVEGTCGRRQERIDGRKRFACFRVFSRTEHHLVPFRVISRTEHLFVSFRVVSRT